MSQEKVELISNKSEDVRHVRDLKHLEMPLEAKNDGQECDPLILAYCYIFESISILHDNARLKVKASEALQAVQDDKIRKEERAPLIQIKQTDLVQLAEDDKLYETITVKVKDKPFGRCAKVGYHMTHKRKTIDAISLEKRQNAKRQLLDKFSSDQETQTAMREVAEDQLSAIRQRDQGLQTDINTNVDESVQGMQQDSAIANMLSAITDKIETR